MYNLERPGDFDIQMGSPPASPTTVHTTLQCDTQDISQTSPLEVSAVDPTCLSSTHVGQLSQIESLEQGDRNPDRCPDYIPERTVPIATEASTARRVMLYVRDSFRTAVNTFGLGRDYNSRPSYDPEHDIRPEDLWQVKYRNVMASINAIQETRTGEDTKPPWPYPNMTVYRLMKWMITGHNRKSEKEITRLAREVINAPDFKADDLKGFDAHRANRILDQSENRDPATGDGWKECNINICVPTRVMNPKGNGKIFAIPHFRYRPLVSVIKSAFSDVSAKSFHLFPFKRIWQPPFGGSEQRVHDELYTSDSWIQAQEALNKQPPEPGCKLERVIAALMFWSDATRLTSFGSVGAWPVYMYFGNLSKYVRAKPTSGACHHVAYIPSVANLSHLSGRFTDGS